MTTLTESTCTGAEAVELADRLQRVGFYPHGEAQLWQCVRAFQADCKLVVDGIVGPKTQAALDAEPDRPRPYGPWCVRDKRLSDALHLLWTADGQGFRYGKVASVKAWQAMQDGKRTAYVVPRVTVTDNRPLAHGCTCGHWGWLFASFWLGGMKPERGITPTWRTGRNGRWIWTVPVEGAMRNGAKARGYADYCAVAVNRPADRGLSALYEFTYPAHFALIEFPSHVATAIRVDDTLHIMDPRTGLPARHGWYRVAADGDSDAAMEKFTFRRIPEGETGGPRYQAAVFDDPGQNGVMMGGPLAGGIAYPMEVE